VPTYPMIISCSQTIPARKWGLWSRTIGGGVQLTVGVFIGNTGNYWQDLNRWAAWASGHSCKFHSGTGRNASYRPLNWYRRAPIPYQVKYPSMPVKYRSIPAVAICIIFFHV
jgi:hypothetical protein